MLMARQPRFISFRSLVACALVAAGPGIASAQPVVSEFSEQKLDRVDVIERSGATNVALDIEAQTDPKPWVATDYPAVASTTGFTACQNTSTRGIYCLDGNVIRRWPNPEKMPPLAPVDGRELFNCGNSVFGFDRDNVCTAMTVDLAGNIWIAGKKKSKFSLFKVVAGACPSTPANTAASTWKPFTTVSGAFCAREYASGRPLLVDLSVVDGDVAEAFPYSEGGVFGVEERREITFFRDIPQATPVVIGAGKDWGLGGGEQLQAVTLLQQPSLTPARNWLLVTTSTGRLLSREIPYPGDPLFAVVNHSSPTGNAVNLVSATTCLSTLTPYYDIRTSVKTRSTYVSDRRGCRLMSLKSNIDAAGFGATTPLSFATPPEVIASTAPTSSLVATLLAPPEGVSIAPGIEVDLRADCGFNLDGTPRECGIVPDGGDNGLVPAAALRGVKIDAGTPSGLTVFQILNIPECRYLPYGTVGECTPVLNTSVTPNVWVGAIIKPDGNVAGYPADYVQKTVGTQTLWFPRDPETLYLDVAKLMPPEVTKVTTLPRMLLSPRYRGLPDTNTFDALFGITDEGVRFRETWLGKFDLGDLIPGRKLGCGETTTIDPTNGPPWDVIVTISERYTTVGGPASGGRQHTDMLVNTYGCDPLDPPISGSRWSLYPYALKLAAERLPDPASPGQFVVRYPDSIFAKLVLSLFNDLGKTIDEYLCFDRDGGNGAPVSASTCSSLQANWVNTQDKLQKCVESSTEPLNSTQIRTCNAFEVQYEPFRAQVTGLMPASLDLANRIGEAKARLEVFRYVYDKQFVPSIPPQGFNDGLYQ